MSEKDDFKNYVLDQMGDLGEMESKNMFGGTALLKDGKAFAKIKHGALWLKVNAENEADFVDAGMEKYRYGKDNSRSLNFYQTPAEVLEDTDSLQIWVQKAIHAAQG